MKSGFVPVVGRPNVGKSTLVNAMVGSKVTITSSRPQTTRNAIRGVVTGPGEDPAYQIVLVDTPGLHKPRNELGTRLNSLVYGTLSEADVVLFMIDATMPVGPGDRLIAERLAEAGSDAVLVVVNKVDKAGKGQVIEQLAVAGEWDFTAYLPVSARVGSGIAELVSEVVDRLPEGPAYYPPGVTTDQPEELVVAEIVREKFLDRLREELPHSLVVMVEDLEQRDDGLIDIAADVIVERKSQKGIVIGKGGSLLQAAGTEARHDLETLLGNRVNLMLQVKVEPDWQRRPQLLDRLGFDRS
jgi:GTP-binding protein Era